MRFQNKKRMGQHFLKDAYYILQIIDNIDASPSDTVVEIGPGLGVLTQHLIRQCKKLHVIELDRDLIPSLLEQFGTTPHFQVHQGDALKIDYQTYYEDTLLKIVGNLPYNISTPLLFHLMQFNSIVSDYTFMLQKEVVDRITATPGSRAYGRLSVMLQIHCDTKSLFDVPPQAFSPPPQVNSAIVRLTPHTRYLSTIKDLNLFSALILTVFNQRRKTMKNNSPMKLAWRGIPKVRADKVAVTIRAC